MVDQVENLKNVIYNYNYDSGGGMYVNGMK